MRGDGREEHDCEHGKETEWTHDYETRRAPGAFATRNVR